MCRDPQAQDDDEQGDEGGPEQHGARHDAAGAQHEHRERRDGDDHDRVDDPLDDDRAQDRRPADALAVTQRMTPIELAEPCRQDVVGEVADVRVAEDAVVGQPRDRREEGLPARPAGGDIEGRRHQHHPDPGKGCRSQDLERGLEIDRPDEDEDREDADGDPERPAEERAAADPHAARQSDRRRRAASFGDRRRRSRWSTYRATTRSVDKP